MRKCLNKLFSYLEYRLLIKINTLVVSDCLKLFVVIK